MPSAIEWTGETWNPVTGCDKVSAGCLNCYAEAMIPRLQAMPHTREKYRNGFTVTCHPDELTRPLRWKKPRLIFVCSMGDLLHDDVPFEFIAHVLKTIRETPHHTYQVLTKRTIRARLFRWPSNVWLGASIETEEVASYRMYDLCRNSEAGARFLSLEPLLGPLPDLNLDGIDWVIVGGETGPNYRDHADWLDWARDIRDQCIAAGVPFFFKKTPGGGCDQLDGVTYHEFPEVARG